MRRPIQIRRGTAAEWAAANPILRPGELGLETDTGRIKAAPGRAGVAWNSIRGYVNRAESRNRYAATSGLGSASTAGAFCSGNWAPSTDGAEDFTIGGVAASTVMQSTTTDVFGRRNANHANIALGAVDSSRRCDILVRNFSTVLATFTDAYVCDGLPHEVLARLTPTGVTLTVDGVTVGTATFATQNWSNVAAVYYVGSGSNAADPRFPGTIFNARFLDHKDANNNIWLNLDEPSGNFSNAYLVATDPLYNVNTTAVSSFTRINYVPMTAVVSTDGRGMPWQSQGPLVYAARQSTDVTGIVADQGITCNVELFDPTGSLANGVLTAPCAGTCIMTWTVAISETAAVADNISAAASLNGATASTGALEVGLAASANRAAICFRARPITLAAGDTYQPRLQGRTGGTFTLHQDYAVTYEFYPTPVAG